MLTFRHTKTASGAQAVQVVTYRDRKVVVLKHIGSANNEEELILLDNEARVWISKYAQQPSIFPSVEPLIPKTTFLTELSGKQFVGIKYGLTYETFFLVYDRLGYATINNALFRDLCIMRLVEPASKVRSLELLRRYFCLSYSERSLYRALPEFLKQKEEIEHLATAFISKKSEEDFSCVFYDVTTLYFESFDSDEFRKPGFSKDSKSQQPQVVVGLLVDKNGFPLKQEIFSGNTFEGKTMLPLVEAFQTEQKIEACTVVADAGMLSFANMEELRTKGLTYIVGARLGNLPNSLFEQIVSFFKNKQEGTIFRAQTAYGDLICTYSKKRECKDRHDMEKQMNKAQKLLEQGETVRRSKFIKAGKKGTYSFNERLQEKTEHLLGLKGYYTNTKEQNLSNKEVIEKYKNLWHVEHSFRMSKSDLVARPIFHRKEDSIKAHLLICFVALSMGEYLEQTTGLSLRKIVDLLGQVPDARLKNIQTKKELLLRAPLSEETRVLLKCLGVSY